MCAYYERSDVAHTRYLYKKMMGKVRAEQRHDVTLHLTLYLRVCVQYVLCIHTHH